MGPVDCAEGDPGIRGFNIDVMSKFLHKFPSKIAVYGSRFLFF
jgi:hypothetical protein